MKMASNSCTQGRHTCDMNWIDLQLLIITQKVKPIKMSVSTRFEFFQCLYLCFRKQYVGLLVLSYINNTLFLSNWQILHSNTFYTFTKYRVNEWEFNMLGDSTPPEIFNSKTYFYTT